MKRNLYIIIGVVVVAAIGITAFIFLKGGSSPATLPGGTSGTLPGVNVPGGTGTQTGNGGTNGASDTTNTNGGAGAGAGQGTAVVNLGIISDQKVFDYFVDASNTVFTVAPDGTIAKIAAGQSSVLSSVPINGLIDAQFSYNGAKILVTFGSQTSPQASLFDVASKAWTPLNPGMVSPQWSPSDMRIAYLTAGTSTALSTIDAVNPKKAAVPLLAANLQDLDLRWITKTQMILESRPSALAQGSLLVFDMTAKTLTPIAYEKAGLTSAWVGVTSSTAPLGLIFSGTGGQYALTLNDLKGSIAQTMNFLTLPSKCAFAIEKMAPAAATSTAATSTKTTSAKPVAPAPQPTYPALYCGIPRDQGAFSAIQLPDAYFERAIYTSDDLYKINAATGAASTILANPAQNFDITQVRAANNMLFFVNRYDGKLYGLSFATSTPQ